MQVLMRSPCPSRPPPALPLNLTTSVTFDGVKQWGLLYSSRIRPAALLAADNTVIASFVYATRAHVPDYMKT